MFLEQWLWFIQNSALARFLDEGRYLTMVIQAFHILAFTFLLAVVLALALRVQGWSLRALPVAQLAATLRRPYHLGLGVALAAGVLLFLPRATTYGAKEIFVWKLLLLALAAGVQALVQQRARNLGEGEAAAAPLKGLALLSLLLWFTTAAAGRAVGFV